MVLLSSGRLVVTCYDVMTYVQESIGQFGYDKYLWSKYIFNNNVASSTETTSQKPKLLKFVTLVAHTPLDLERDLM